MNTLSWALYAAEVLDNLKGLLLFVALALGPGFYVVTFFQRIGEPPSRCWPWPKGYLALAVILGLVAGALPSSRTVYLIAASEAGERVVSSPEGREMSELIRRKIRDALSDRT